MQEKRPALRVQSTCLPQKIQGIDELDLITPNKPKSVMTKCDKSKMRAVVFRDSFFEPLIPFMAEDFNQIVYIWTQYDHSIMEKLIEQQKPQIVIEEMVERLLILVRERSGRDGTIAADPTSASMQH
jgi:hypothetical protein